MVIWNRYSETKDSFTGISPLLSVFTITFTKHTSTKQPSMFEVVDRWCHCNETTFEALLDVTGAESQGYNGLTNIGKARYKFFVSYSMPTHTCKWRQ